MSGRNLVSRRYGRSRQVLDVPPLLDLPHGSFRRFLDHGLREVLDEVSPIDDFTGARMSLSFGSYRIEPPALDPRECLRRAATYEARVSAEATLLDRESGEMRSGRVHLCLLPMMTANGSFVFGGAERVVISQLVRSPGAYFSDDPDPFTGHPRGGARIIPSRGAWLDFGTADDGTMYARVDRSRRFPMTLLLRALDDEEGLGDDERGSDERLTALLLEGREDARGILAATLEADGASCRADALPRLFARVRPGEPATAAAAAGLPRELFGDPKKYGLGEVGRYKLNLRLGFGDEGGGALRAKDVFAAARGALAVNRGEGETDDIDHLANRRVRPPGEIVQQQFRIGMLRTARAVREKMIMSEPSETVPTALVNSRPLQAALNEFFGGSQLSQYMEQTNPLAELGHKRRLSALGPGGLTRDRAGADVRDVHYSHYGRICPIETPEGATVGLIGNLAVYGRVNDLGFIESPYRPVLSEVSPVPRELLGRVLDEDVADAAGAPLARAGDAVGPALALAIAARGGGGKVRVRPFAAASVAYLGADDEEERRIAAGDAPLDASGNLPAARYDVREGGLLKRSPPGDVDYVDVSPGQIASVAASLVPFLDHDDTTRALMGANMQRQAVPLVRPDRPLVATGMERHVARHSGQVVYAEEDGTVLSASAGFVSVRYDSGREERYPLSKFVRSNQGTCVNQRPVVGRGDRVARGQPLADSAATAGGELALGQSMLVAFLSWGGLNFEDAIVLSENVVRDGKMSSIHIEHHEIDARETPLGPEEFTRDLPGSSPAARADLDERGMIRVGAKVEEGGILVGKIAPRGEHEETPEERLLRAIFGSDAAEVRDASLRMPHGAKGQVIAVQTFTRDDAHASLPPRVLERVRVTLAHRRAIGEGDKMAGRHGNKGVVSRVVPAEDMPFLADGRPVEALLSPLGVPSRMNVGQLLETHLGWAADSLGMQAVTPVFDGATDRDVEDALALAWLALQADAVLPETASRNGRMAETASPAGERVDQPRLEAYLREGGFDPERALAERGAALRACRTLWLEQRGRRGVRGLGDDELARAAAETARELGEAEPVSGKADRLRRADRRTVRPARRRRPHVHDQALPPGRGQDARPARRDRTRSSRSSRWAASRATAASASARWRCGRCRATAPPTCCRRC